MRRVAILSLCFAVAVLMVGQEASARGGSRGVVSRFTGVNKAVLRPLDGSFFGLNMGSSSLVGWTPASIPVTHARIFSQVAFVPPSSYILALAWKNIETSNDFYVWGSVDTEAAALAAHGVKVALWTPWELPKWAVKENNRAATVTGITVANPAEITVPGNTFTQGNTPIFFYGTGTLPAGLAMETDYCITGGNFWEDAPDTTFTLNNCAGVPIATTGGSFSGTIRVTLSRSNPANEADLRDFISRLYTRLKSHGLQLWVEGANEWSAREFYNAGKADVVTFQNWLWGAAKSAGPGVKVFMPPVNSMFNIEPDGGYKATFPPNVAKMPLADAYSIHGYNTASAGYNSTTSIAAPTDAAMTFSRSQGFKDFIISEFSTVFAGNPKSARLAFNAIYLAQLVSLAVSRRGEGMSQVYPYFWNDDRDAKCPDSVGCYAMCVDPCAAPTGTPNVVGVAWAQMIAWYTGTTHCAKPSMTADVQEMLCLKKNGSKQQTVWHSVYANTSNYTAPAWANFQTDIAGAKTAIVGGVVALTRAPKLLTAN